MHSQHFPKLDISTIAPTRNALHAYSQILGAWLKDYNTKRKHWWHASLRPSLNGLTTGVVREGIDFEIELNLRESVLQLRTSTGAVLSQALDGQPALVVADRINGFLVADGLDEKVIPASNHHGENIVAFRDYSPATAGTLGCVLHSVFAALTEFRAGIREETSPIQLWPHHFDVSMLWLPGDKVPDQDPDDEEYADKQMNFGFTFGDEGIPEPYFYVTAYPLPNTFPQTSLPAGATWHSDGFKGVVLLYKTLSQSSDPTAYLLELWQGLLTAGREQMLTITH
ncbi:MAG: DUF5996 family protein [Gammaproteobacteria bacterium]|nr:DUF5996 family protein [Gammaproteobacteria bacterium]